MSRISGLSATVSVLALIGASLAQPAAAATCTWTGGNGAYGNGGSWSCGIVPTSVDDVFIDGGNGAVSIVMASGSQGALTLTISNADELRQASSTFTIAGATVMNNGTITIGINSQFRGSGAALSFGGTGTIVLNDVGSSFTQFLDTATNATLGSGQTVRGSGSIGLNVARITNNGVISADVAGRVLTIDGAGGNAGLAGLGIGSGGNAAFVNTGTVQATGAGTLAINGGRYENSGTIQALVGSTVIVGSDARIVGGTLSSVGSGVIIDGGGTAYLEGVTLSAGSQYLVTSADLNLATTFVNNGTVTIGVNSQVRSDTPTLEISGIGTIVLDDTGSSFTEFLDNATTTTLGAGQTVRGSGSVGVNSAVIVNNGVIRGDVGGRALEINVRGGNGGLAGAGVGAGSNAGLLNNTLIEASNGGIVSIGGGRYENSVAGIIRAATGSTVIVGSDARIVGGTLSSVGSGVIIDGAGTAYLDGVTLATGSTYTLSSADLNLATTFVNNGTLTIGVNSRVRNDTATLMISGNGTIILNDIGSSFTQLFDNATTATLGAGQIVRGSGDIGINQAVITNNGVIRGDVGGRTLNIDARGGNAGVAVGTGVGTGGIAGLLNNNLIEASNGGIVSIGGGRYENSASGALAVGTTGTLTMLNDANLVNLAAGGVLDRGSYRSLGGTLTLRGAGAAIAVIGTSAAGTDTVVTLSGTGSTINALPISGGTATAIDATLRQVDNSGRLEILNNRSLTIVAGGGGGTLTNNGIIQIGGGTLSAASLVNTNATASSEIFGFGAINAATANSGTVRSAGGTLTISAVNGTGALQSDAGSTLALGSNATTGRLTNNGTLALGGSNVAVATDYTNANFGSGNAFNGRANVTGGGLILADSATQTLSAPGLSGNTLDLGNLRVGGANQTVLTVTNNGTLTTLRGAVQNGSAPGVSLSNTDFVIGPNGGSSAATISFAGAVAGSLAGQTINVVNNFDNVANASLNLQGAVFNAAIGVVSPDPINLGNVRVGGTASGIVTIANIAPAGPFSEGLAITNTTTTGGAGVSGVPAGLIAAGNSGTATVSLATATAGAQSGTVGFGFATDGAGTSGLAALAIAGGSVTVNANVFALANPFITSPLQFGNVQQNTVQTRTINVENRQLAGVLAAFQEGLNAGFGVFSGDVQSATGNIVNLAAGGIDTTTLTVRLDTGSAGAKNGTVEILLQSNGTGTSGLGNLDLAAQNVIVLGQVDAQATVYRLAEATLAPVNIAFGSRRIGDAAPTQVLTITNSAIADGFSESLDATSGSTTGRATASGGPVSLLAAGSSSTAISVGVDTSVAGANGSVTINFASNGAGTSELGITPLAAQVVTLGGAVYQAAVAGAQPASITLAARRVGDTAASANLTISNAAPGSGGFTESLSATASANNGFSTDGNGPVTTADLGVGGSQAIAISRGTGTAGAFNGSVAIANTSLASAGSGLANLALGGQSVTLNANVYAAAIALVDAATVDFGTVRQGATAPIFALGISNVATGALIDSLVTSIGATPAGITAGAPAALAGGASGTANFSLSTATAGQVGGSTSLGFASSNPEIADLALSPQTIAFAGTVTEVAIAQLFKASGTGGFTGGGNAYTLNFGNYAIGTGQVIADLGVLNAIAASSFSETLGGGFVLTPGTGYSFSGASFAGLIGSASDIGNILTFNYTGLSAGFYTTKLTFNGISSFSGLGDLALAPIELTINARIASVPEPAIWAQFILGFGAIGGLIRRRRGLANGAVSC